MAVGHANKNKIFYSKAKGLNKPVVYVGSKTGRDGIHGASMASAEFDENSEDKKPTVQVGDPFTEKLLLEACLQLMKDNSIISIQDMGAAGLTSSSVEMAHKGSLGLELDLSKVPCREENMTPYEMMLSESQERMLIILEEGKEESAKKIFDKWDLDFKIIGKTTSSNKLILKYDNKTVADIPINALSTDAPIYQRKWEKTKLVKNKKLNNIKKGNFKESLLKILTSPNHSNKKWITQQYDQMVMGDTILRSGSDAAVIKIHQKNKAIAVSVDSSANYCNASPQVGGKQIVCENWRNLISVGSRPIAITNCLNFGNPENKKIMGQFVETIDGIKEACEYLDFPVVSGNVSFYNGTNKKNIFPTPVIGGVGLVQNLNKVIDHRFKDIGNEILVIGKTFGHLHQSVYMNEILGINDGLPPEVNLKNEKNNGQIIMQLIDNNFVRSVHDISAGGIILCLAEMSMSSGIGVKIARPNKLSNIFEYFFGEDQSRYIVEIKKEKISATIKLLNENNIFHETIGQTQANNFSVEKEFDESVDKIYKLNNTWFKNINATIKK